MIDRAAVATAIANVDYEREKFEDNYGPFNEEWTTNRHYEMADAAIEAIGDREVTVSEAAQVLLDADLPPTMDDAMAEMRASGGDSNRRILFAALKSIAEKETTT